jgi:hypothetical protein
VTWNSNSKCHYEIPTEGDSNWSELRDGINKSSSSSSSVHLRNFMYRCRKTSQSGAIRAYCKHCKYWSCSYKSPRNIFFQYFGITKMPNHFAGVIGC